MTYKLFLCKIWIRVFKTTQNFMLISKLLRKCEKFANKKVTAKKKCEKSEVLLFYTTNFGIGSVWHITFSGWIFFHYFHRFEIGVKFCEFWILLCQKRTKKFWGHWVHIWVYVRTIIMQIRKKWLNQLKNFFNKHVWEYYLASFCWWNYEIHCTLVHMEPK